MKAIKLFAFGIMLMLAGSTQAQFSVSVNIGTPPAWGPAGYSDVRYYYLPDVEAYYDVQTSMFVYMSGHHWIRRSYLPTRYRNYDLYRGYKVVMNDYRGNSPYTRFNQHRVKYSKGYRGAEQPTNGQRNNQYKNHDNRNDYQATKNNEHGNDKKQGRGNDKDKGDKKDNGRGNGNRR